MTELKVILPAMGESIFEATITQWMVNEGDTVTEDCAIVEIATDKVDSEVPAPVSGTLHKILVQVGEVAKIGQAIAIIYTANEVDAPKTLPDKNLKASPKQAQPIVEQTNTKTGIIALAAEKPQIPFKLNNGKFLSPLVRNIANKENITAAELETIQGTGVDNRITKDDILNFLLKRQNTTKVSTSLPQQSVEVVEMDRVRKIIARHMLTSKQTSPHVTSFHEVDVTAMVKWREHNKDLFFSRFGQKLTFTPIFIDAVAKAIKKFPMINVSVDGDKILKKSNINIGMATAMPDGNLIVPVIHAANELNTLQLIEKVNDLANRARSKKLQPFETQEGTFTVTNVGAFGNLSGTPIINQPEAAILAIGTLKKRPAVIETPDGDFIGIRSQLILSLSYDHRVIDGALGGMFLKQIADNMEAFNAAEWMK